MHFVPLGQSGCHRSQDPPSSRDEVVETDVPETSPIDELEGSPEEVVYATVDEVTSSVGLASLPEIKLVALPELVWKDADSSPPDAVPSPGLLVQPN